MKYEIVIMYQNKNDRPSFYRKRASGQNPDDALSAANRFINVIKVKSYRCAISNIDGKSRENIFETLKEIKYGFSVVGIREVAFDFAEGEIREGGKSVQRCKSRRISRGHS